MEFTAPRFDYHLGSLSEAVAAARGAGVDVSVAEAKLAGLQKKEAEDKAKAQVEVALAAAEAAKASATATDLGLVAVDAAIQSLKAAGLDSAEEEKTLQELRLEEIGGKLQRTLTKCNKAAEAVMTQALALAAGEDQRITLDDLVEIVDGEFKGCRGVVIQDDRDSEPYKVRCDDGRTTKFLRAAMVRRAPVVYDFGLQPLVDIIDQARAQGVDVTEEAKRYTELRQEESDGPLRAALEITNAAFLDGAPDFKLGQLEEAIVKHVKDGGSAIVDEAKARMEELRGKLQTHEEACKALAEAKTIIALAEALDYAVVVQVGPKRTSGPRNRLCDLLVKQIKLAQDAVTLQAGMTTAEKVTVARHIEGCVGHADLRQALSVAKSRLRELEAEDVRRAERKQLGLPELEVPSEHLCPITSERMTDPVTASDGFTYERANITQWLENHQTSPQTGAPLPNRNLVQNQVLRIIMREFPEKEHKRLMALKRTLGEPTKVDGLPVLTRQRTGQEVQEMHDNLKENLRRLGLASHADKFIESGYDQWDQVMEMSTQQLHELVAEVGISRGHAMRLQQHVHNTQLLAKRTAVSAEKFHAKAKKLFAQMDADDDGMVSYSELLAFLAAGGEIEPVYGER